MGCSGERAIDEEKIKALEELKARQELKALVDSYANESDRNNQDYYVMYLLKIVMFEYISIIN